MAYQLVWFKRDLRIVDHAALSHAAQQGPVVCIYVIEPGLWSQPDAAHQHYAFIQESLQELHLSLQNLGGQLHVVVGEVDTLLAQIFQQAPFAALYSHQETGNAATYQRDKAVARWCKQHQVPWHEYPQFGVVRALPSRNSWQTRWEAHASAPCWPALEQAPAQHMLRWAAVPERITSAPHGFPSSAALGLTVDSSESKVQSRQRGGRSEALQVLNSFLHSRCAQYRGGISSPLSAPRACSRLSPYLAYGCISLREVVQATRQHLASLPLEAKYQRLGLAAFTSRLYWHCHFIQKLESEPELEWRNLHRGYDGLREADWNPAHFQALVDGRTGWPMVDACVVMLRETGWLNFRMRAMLVSVASFPLWLHWRPVGEWLATQFLDYEPGIHWSQMQMQSGTTGINIARVYNPIKQAQDHDPHGHFVRRWLPAMRKVPDAWLWEPWRMPPELQQRYGVAVGTDIPMPLVDLEAATRQAKARLYTLRAQPEVRAAKASMVQKHGSRKRPERAVRQVIADSRQIGLDF